MIREGCSKKQQKLTPKTKSQKKKHEKSAIFVYFQISEWIKPVQIRAAGGSHERDNRNYKNNQKE
jgi:hypothetical protein